MPRQNPLPLFLLLVFLFLLGRSHDARGQAPVTDSISAAQQLQFELGRIEQLTQFGPHYKNPKAAGRLLTLRRAVPSLPPNYEPLRLTGPAYKNRKPSLPASEPTEAAPAAPSRLYGPRYKNRGAKSGNL